MGHVELLKLIMLQGTLKLLVKWKGYEDDSDRTWEEEEGLMYVYGLVLIRFQLCALTNKHHRDGARDIVTAYYKKIGGRPQKPEEKPTPGKPGRKRKSIGTPKAAAAKQSPKATGAKRQRRQTTEDKQQKQETQERSPVEEDVVEWLPKSKNWDKDVKEVQTITKGDENNGLMACIEFNNGHTTKLSLQASYQKCPMKVSQLSQNQQVRKKNERITYSVSN